MNKKRLAFILGCLIFFSFWGVNAGSLQACHQSQACESTVCETSICCHFSCGEEESSDDLIRAVSTNTTTKFIAPIFRVSFKMTPVMSRNSGQPSLRSTGYFAQTVWEIHNHCIKLQC